MKYDEYDCLRGKVNDSIKKEGVTVEEYVDAAVIVDKIENVFRQNKVSEDIKNKYLETHDMSKGSYPDGFNWDKFGKEMAYNQYSVNDTHINTQLENMKLGDNIMDALKKYGFADQELYGEGKVTVELITEEFRSKHGFLPDLFFEEGRMPPYKDNFGIETGDLLKVTFEGTEGQQYGTVAMQTEETYHVNKDDGTTVSRYEVKVMAMQNLDREAEGYIKKQAKLPYMLKDDRRGAEGYEINFKRLPTSITEAYAAVKTEMLLKQYNPFGGQSYEKDRNKIWVSKDSFNKAELSCIMNKVFNELERDSKLLTPRESDKYVEFDNMVDTVMEEIAMKKLESILKMAKGKPSRGKMPKNNNEDQEI